MLKGTEAQERCRAQPLLRRGAARFDRVRLWRNAELDERRIDRQLKGHRPSPQKEDHKVEETANDKVGSLNP